MDLLADVLQPGAKVLDIGSGSGYMSACFAELVGPTGHVYGIDHIQGIFILPLIYMVELVDQSVVNIKKGNANLLERITLKGKEGCDSHSE